MSSPPRKCDECRFPPFIGTRCAQHYVRRHARSRGLHKTSWWSRFEPTIVGVVVARHLMVMDGEPTPPFQPEMIFGKMKYREIPAVAEIVRRAEAQSRRQRDDRYGSSEENRG